MNCPNFPPIDAYHDAEHCGVQRAAKISGPGARRFPGVPQQHDAAEDELRPPKSWLQRRDDLVRREAGRREGVEGARPPPVQHVRHRGDASASGAADQAEAGDELTDSVGLKNSCWLVV